MGAHAGSQWRRFVGALRSRHPAALLGMVLKAVGPATRTADRLLLSRPRRKMTQDAHVRCALLVCPPRSGGTVVFQSLTQAISCVYPCNGHALLPSLGTRLLRAGRSRLAAGQSFNNYYGYTSRLADVWEGNVLFEGFSSAPGTTDADARLRLAFERLVALLAPRPSECVIFKNVAVYSEISRLHDAIDDLVFVRVRRDPCQVVQSAIRAYRELGTFHPVPESLRNRPIGDPIEFACAQISEMERVLDAQFTTLRVDRTLEIPYEDFCARPMEYAETLAYQRLGMAPGSVRSCPALDRLRPSSRKKVSGPEAARIESLMAKAAAAVGVAHG